MQFINLKQYMNTVHIKKTHTGNLIQQKMEEEERKAGWLAKKYIVTETMFIKFTNKNIYTLHYLLELVSF